MNMIKYPKINSIFRRDEKGKFTHGFSDPIFEYLWENEWYGTEKIDGTNIRIGISIDEKENAEIDIRGRTDRAQLTEELYNVLENTAKKIIASEVLHTPTNVIFFGEGYGKNIQKAGKLYSPDEYKFILFDLWINGQWIQRELLKEIAEKAEIDIVPIMYEGPLYNAVDIVKKGIISTFSNSENSFQSEGLVLKPKIELKDPYSRPILTKLKTKDWE